MIINGFVTFHTAESSVEIIGFVADPFYIGRQMAKDRRAGIVVADAGDLKRAGLAFCGGAELG